MEPDEKLRRDEDANSMPYLRDRPGFVFVCGDFVFSESIAVTSELFHAPLYLLVGKPS